MHVYGTIILIAFFGSFILACWAEGGQVKTDASTVQGGESEASRHD